MFGTINTGMNYHQMMREFNEYVVSIMTGERTVCDWPISMNSSGITIDTAAGEELLAVFYLDK